MQNRNKKHSFLFISIALVLLLLGCVSISPPLENQPDSLESTVPLEVSRVGIEESKAAFDNGEAVFLDVRSESSYATGHIPGALSIPLADLEMRMEELDPDQWIITYCT